MATNPLLLTLLAHGKTHNRAAQNLLFMSMRCRWSKFNLDGALPHYTNWPNGSAGPRASCYSSPGAVGVLNSGGSLIGLDARGAHGLACSKGRELSGAKVWVGGPRGEWANFVGGVHC
jgi:hypothetical protein